LGIVFGVVAEGVSVETEGFCPAGRAFFLIRQKETKIRLMGCAPKDPLLKTVKDKGRGQVKGKMTPVSHLRLCTVARTLQPEVVGVEEPMVKGGGCRWCDVLL